MTKKETYRRMKSLLALAWKNDDYMSQESLFELQQKLANYTLDAASDCGEVFSLADEFPWLYAGIAAIIGGKKAGDNNG